MKLNCLESFHQLECVFTGFSFLFQKQSNNWLKNRKNSEFVVWKWLLDSVSKIREPNCGCCIVAICLEYVLAHYLISFANFVS